MTSTCHMSHRELVTTAVFKFPWKGKLSLLCVAWGNLSRKSLFSDLFIEMKEQSRSGLHTTIMCSPNSGNRLSDSPNHYQLTTSADILYELPQRCWIPGPPFRQPVSYLQHMCFRKPINVCWQFQIEVTCCHGAKYPLSPLWMPGREGSFVSNTSVHFYIATNIQIWWKEI